MSLESELSRNTEALMALTAALHLHASVPAPEVQAKTLKWPSLLTTKTDLPPSLSTASVDELFPLPQSAASVVAAPVVVEYAVVSKAITDVFKTDRAKVMAALGKFNAARGPQLKVEDYAAFLAELGA